jgi:hypothetical protein
MNLIILKIIIFKNLNVLKINQLLNVSFMFLKLMFFTFSSFKFNIPLIPATIFNINVYLVNFYFQLSFKQKYKVILGFSIHMLSYTSGIFLPRRKFCVRK